MSDAASRDVGDGGLAVVLTGGGARAAFQVGFLRALGRRYPDLPIEILTGVSAGAINTAYLASHPGNFEQRTSDLERLWVGLEPEQVYTVGTFDLLRNLARWSMRLVSGGRRGTPRPRGMVDTRPLRRLLTREIDEESRKHGGIQARLKEGPLRAVAVTTTSYSTGQTITWLEGRDTRTWRRPHRMTRRCTIDARHVLASCSIPFLFPAVEIDGQWHGDGGVRHYAPLSPAVHLGASKILALSTRYARTPAEADRPTIEGYPPPAQVGGVLFNAIFLDLLDSDAQRMERLNRIIEKLPPEERANGIRPIGLNVIRPPQDIGIIANEYEVRLPRTFRFLMRGLGTKETRSNDMLSLMMFQSEYVKRLIALGEEEFERRRDEIDAFLAD